MTSGLFDPLAQLFRQGEAALGVGAGATGTAGYVGDPSATGNVQATGQAALSTQVDFYKRAFAATNELATNSFGFGGVGGLSRGALALLAGVGAVGIVAGGTNQGGQLAGQTDPVTGTEQNIGAILGTGAEAIGHAVGQIGQSAAPAVGKGTQQGATGLADVGTSGAGGAVVGAVGGAAQGIGNVVSNATNGALGGSSSLLIVAGLVIVAVLLLKR